MQNRVYKQVLVNLNLKENTKNNGMKALAETNYVIEGQGGIKQFILDWVFRQMMVEDVSHLGLTKSELENVTDELVTERLERYFPGKSKQIFAAISQYIAGFFIYALDQGLACTHTDAQTISILQPRPEDTQIKLTKDPDRPNDILCVCTFQKFPIVFFENPKLSGFLAGPLTLVFRLVQISENKFGFDFDSYDTENKLIDMIYHGELLSDELIISYVLGPENSDTSLFDSAIIVPKFDCKRHGNNDPKVQFDRDIQMISNAIERPGNTIGGEVLRKLYTLLYFSDLYYQKDKQWHLWRNSPDKIPIASVLCHGSRTLIQFPADMSEDILQWLMGKPDERSYHRRPSATHGIEAIPENDQVKIGTDKKYLYESKLSFTGAAINTFYRLAEITMDTVYGPALDNHYLQHYGIDLALGGAGFQNEVSINIIASNGEHGHLYLCYNLPKQSTNIAYAGLLIGIEQSSPTAHKDQYGGRHTITGTHLDYTATGGDDFAKPPLQVDTHYQGLKNIGPDRYYDGLFVALDKTLFEHIKMMEPGFRIDMLASCGTKLEIAPKLDVDTLKKQELHKIREEVEELQNTKSKLMEENAGLITACEALQLTIYNLKKTEQQLTESITRLGNTKEVLQAEQEKIQNNKLKLEDALQETQKKLGHHELEYQQLLELKKTTLQETEEIRREHEELLRQINEASSTLEKLQISIAKAKEEQDNLLEANQNHEVRNREEQNNVDEQQQQKRPPPPPPGFVIDSEIQQENSNRVIDQRTFWQKHWKKILVGAAIGAVLVVAGVLTGGLVPLIAAGFGISFGAAAVIGFGGAIAVGGAIGAGAGSLAGAMPTQEQPGVKSFLNRHKGKIILSGIIAAIIIGSVLTGGILGAVGAVAGVGVLATIASGISVGLASTVGVGAGLTTAVAGAAIVTAGAATVGTSTGMLVGALVDQKAKNVIHDDEIVEPEQQPVPPPQSPKKKLFGLFSLPSPNVSFTNIFHREGYRKS